MQLTLLDNFYTWARTVLFGSTVAFGELNANASSHGTRPTNGDLYNTNGEKLELLFFYEDSGYYKLSRNTTIASGEDIIFYIGKNNSPFEKTDNQWEIKEKITFENNSIKHSIIKKKNGLDFLVTIQNLNDENIEIGEIGFYKKIFSATPVKESLCLLGRATFDIPEIITPQTSKAYQITLEL